MNIRLKGAVVALALLGGALPAAAEDVEFTLHNNTDRALHYFYTTPSNDTSWGEDLLGEDGTLEAGYQSNVWIGDGETECLYDFKFVMDDGSETVVNEVDICSLSSYTLYD